MSGIVTSVSAAVGEALFKKRVIVVMGKGGVGRTTVATAIAQAAARRGKRVLLFQAGAKDKLSRLIGSPPVGEQIMAVPGGFSAVNTSPSAAIHEYGLMVLRYETIYRLVMENQVVKKLVRAIPGLDDYSIIGKLWFHTTETHPAGGWKWDTIVFDAPATGHALTMFKIPRAILAAVPEGPLTRDAVKVRALFEDASRTTVVLTTLAEEMPVTETLELAAKLQPELGLTPSALVVNQIAPDRFYRQGVAARVLDELVGADAGAGDPVLAPLVREARQQRARRQLNERYIARLQAELKLPQVRLPMLFSPSFGAAEVGFISQEIERQLLGGQDAATVPVASAASAG
jgi:anion-transporting  ArsA/GET3 family ATPase